MVDAKQLANIIKEFTGVDAESKAYSTQSNCKTSQENQQQQWMSLRSNWTRSNLKWSQDLSEKHLLQVPTTIWCKSKPSSYQNWKGKTKGYNKPPNVPKAKPKGYKEPPSKTTKALIILAR